MARYKLTISCEFDTAYPMTAHTEVARNIVNVCCPSTFNFIDASCNMTDCVHCWFRALEGGVSSGEESVHVERLD